MQQPRSNNNFCCVCNHIINIFYKEIRQMSGRIGRSIDPSQNYNTILAFLTFSNIFGLKDYVPPRIKTRYPQTLNSFTIRTNTWQLNVRIWKVTSFFTYRTHFNELYLDDQHNAENGTSGQEIFFHFSSNFVRFQAGMVR